MTDSNQKTAVEHAQEELVAIDRALFALFIKREAFSDSMKRLTGVEPDPFVYERVDYQKSNFLAAFDAQPSIEAAEPQLAGGQVYRPRYVNKRMIEEAIRIIVASGKPMSTPEILKTHSMRNEVTADAMYRLMYNRMVVGTLISIDGAFWPADRELPAGFDLARANPKGNRGNDGKAAA